MSSEDIKKKILEKIKQGEVAMKPKWHFVLESVLAIIGIVILSLGLLYILSFIVFALRQSGVMFAPAFGLRGVFAFLYSSPWILILLAVLFVGVLEILVRKYSFTYKKPIVYVLLGIVVISLAGSYAIAQTTMHERIQKFAERGHLPPVGSVYERYAKPQLRDVHVGVITEIQENRFIFENRQGRETYVEINEKSKVSIELKEDTHVVVFGKRTEEGITALGVGPLPKDVQFERPMRKDTPKPYGEVQGKWRRNHK